ncbi:MAG: hypothetical protein NTU66_04320 [Elusimicrobia bacterium]|nr:hypothetical protein [Elusimicrobiota bacterium]
MKKLTLSFIVLFISLPAAAAFKDAGWGARPLGMGGAFTAVANDANGPLFNPAGIDQVTHKEATFMSSKLFTGLEGVEIGQNYFGYIHPLGRQLGTLGIVWSSLYAPGYYREDTGSISYGKYIESLSSSKINVSMGASMRYLRHEYSLDQYTSRDPVFANGYSAAAMTADFGALVALPKMGLSFAFASKCVNSPDVGLKTPDVVPNENVAAVAYYTNMLPYVKLPNFTIDADVVNRDNITDVRIGVETWLMNGKFAIRAGERPQEISMGLGYELGFKKSATVLVIDYAFGWPLQMEQTTGTHRMAVTVRFP